MLSTVAHHFHQAAYQASQVQCLFLGIHAFNGLSPCYLHAHISAPESFLFVCHNHTPKRYVSPHLPYPSLVLLLIECISSVQIASHHMSSSALLLSHFRSSADAHPPHCGPTIVRLFLLISQAGDDSHSRLYLRATNAAARTRCRSPCSRRACSSVQYPSISACSALAVTVHGHLHVGGTHCMHSCA